MIGNPSTMAASGEQPAPTARIARRGLQSGFSLLARGEPQIWFTGGMLAVCLAMIVSLLGLILYNGLSTFWPGRVSWLLLRDGSMDVGEAQRSEPIEITGSPVPTEQTEVVNNVSAGTGATAFRRNFRTGNFDLTGRHYRWFAPDELSETGIAFPEWLAIVERLEWGRLYGLPSRLTEIVLPPDDVTQELATIGRTRDFLAEAASSGDAQARATADRAEELLQNRSAEQLSRSLRQLAGNRSGLGVIQAKVDGQDAWQDAKLIGATGDVLDAREYIDSEERVYQRLARLLPELAQQRRSIDRLKHTISQFDERITAQHVAIRAAELESGEAALQLIEGLDVLIEEIVGLSEKRKLLDESKQGLSDLVTDSELRNSLSSLLEQYLGETVDVQIRTLQEQLDERQKVSNKSPRIQAAISEYVRVWREVAESKLPLQAELARLESSLSRAEVVFCMPSPSTVLDACLPEEMAELRSGKWPSKIIEQLKAQSLIPLPNSLRLEAFNSYTTLATFLDAQRGRQFLWLRASESGGSISASLSGEFAVPCHHIVRIFPANRLTLAGQLSVYVDRWKEFLTENPREANAEGGVFPAIWGTVVMTLIMTIAVVPFGVMAALYLREYTRSGIVVSIIRISINNLAGVPSIVYGVFGFAFFCYIIGAWVDGGPRNADIVPLPPPIWSVLLGALAVVGTASFLFSFLSSGPSHTQTKLKVWMSRCAGLGWLLCAVAIAVLLLKNPYFDGFYAASLPNPTFGKGGLLWASLTLALLTLPVVIVATEEALSAVPNSLREGSLACGASKWQTIRRIVLPHARPGIMTGAILAMARGAGEVAPLMLVGALPTAPDLPLDSEFPYFHGSRNFMHLGYQIYFLGFQSQNSDASRPMVFTCTLLLILIIAALNLSAIFLRSRLRRRFLGNQF